MGRAQDQASPALVLAPFLPEQCPRFFLCTCVVRRSLGKLYRAIERAGETAEGASASRWRRQKNGLPGLKDGPGCPGKTARPSALLDMWCLWVLFAMLDSLVRCSQAIRHGLLVHLQGPQARRSACLQGLLAEEYGCLQARPLLFASRYS